MQQINFNGLQLLNLDEEVLLTSRHNESKILRYLQYPHFLHADLISWPEVEYFRIP